MTAKIGQRAAVATLVQVSIELDRLLEATPLTGLFLRSLDGQEQAFVPKESRGWFSRSVERVQALGSKATPYSLEANMAYLHELTEIVVQSPFTPSATPNPELARRFHNSVPEALQSLLVRLEALMLQARKPALQVKVAEIKALFDHKFQDHFQVKKAVEDIVKGFLVDDRYALFTSSLVWKLFDQYQRLLADIHNRIGEGIADKEEAHVLKERLEKEMLQALQKRLHARFELFQKQAIEAIRSAKTVVQFHEAKQHIQEEVRALIAIDQKLTSKPLCALFCMEMQAFSEAVLRVEMPRYGELITQDVLPKIQDFLTEAETKSKEELSILLNTIEKYLQFLEEVALQLKCPNNATSCPESELLERAILMLRSGKQSIERKAAPMATQTASGTGNTMIQAHTVNIVNGKNGAEECLLDDVAGGIVPTGALPVLRYGTTILVSAATTYFTSGVSLGWSLVSGVVFTAAPSMAKAAVRQVLPRAVVSVMDPLIDFAARLLIWRYGTSTIQMMAGQTPQPQPQEPAAANSEGVVAEIINSPAIPVLMGGFDVVQHVRKKEPVAPAMHTQRVQKPLFPVPPVDTMGVFTKSVAYLSALFWMRKQVRDTSI